MIKTIRDDLRGTRASIAQGYLEAMLWANLILYVAVAAAASVATLWGLLQLVKFLWGYSPL